MEYIKYEFETDAEYHLGKFQIEEQKRIALENNYIALKCELEILENEQLNENGRS